MLFINGFWERINTIDDAINICRAIIGDEFAEKLESFYTNDYRIIDLESEIADLEGEMMDYEDVSDRLYDIEHNICLLEKYIKVNDSDSEFMNGMKRAFAIIEGKYNFDKVMKNLEK